MFHVKRRDGHDADPGGVPRGDPHRPVCDYEGSDYQASFWEGGGREYEDRVEAVALRRLLPPGGSRMLEIGAGAGRNTPRYRGFREVVLLDYSRTQLEQARTRLGHAANYRYVVGDVYSLPFAEGVFDAASMIRVLHHMVEPPAALSEARRVMCGGGAFVLEFANKRNLKAILRWALGRQDWSPFAREPVEFADLNFNFHPAAIRKWLREAGFVVRRIRTVSHFRVGLLKQIVPTGVLVGADALAQLTGDLWQLSPSVFVRADVLTGGAQTKARDWSWRCPVCGGEDLLEEPDALRCRSCGRLWSTEGGIYDFKKPVDG